MLAFTKRIHPVERGLLSRLKSSLEKIWNHPDDRCAVDSDQGLFIYQDLREKSQAVVAALRERNITQSCVGILSSRSFSAYVAVLGTIASENFVLPLATRNPDLRNLDLIRKLNTKIILFENCDSDYAMTLKSSLSNVEFLNIENLTKSIAEVSIRLYKYTYAMCTSGSTGESHIVLIGPEQFSAFLENIFSILQIEATARISQTYDLIFDPSFADIFLAFEHGACLVPLSSKYQFNIFDFISEKKLTHWSSVPSLVWLNLKRSEIKNYQGLTHSIFTGEHLTQGLCEKWRAAYAHTEIMNFYGPVETCIWVSSFMVREDSSSHCPVGKAFQETEIEVVDSFGHKLASGVEGELVIGGVQVCDGYFSDPAATIAKFREFSWDLSQKKWFYPGDIGVINSDKTINILGRTDNQFKIAGQRMSSEEIERIFYEVTGQYSCFAFAIDDHVVLAILEDIGEIKPLKILEEMKRRLPPLFIPKVMYKFFDIKLTNSGKLNRKDVMNRIQRKEQLIEYR